MMKADAARMLPRKLTSRPLFDFDDQVDVVFQLEPVDQQPAKTPAAQ
ncbi:hypothetical protein ACLK11_16785 [Escherichia coli]